MSKTNYFDDEQLVTILNSSEEDKLALLRDNNFLSNVNSNYLNLILNNLCFTSVFSILQNKDLLSKINKIDVKLTSKDHLFYKDYLNQEDLVNKTSSTMIKNMLINLPKKDILDYLNKENIINNLSNEDIIELSSLKNIDLINDYKYMDKLNDKEIISYINKSFKNNVNYNLVNNTYVKRMFPNNVNMDEILYLYDLFTTKTNQKIEDVNHSFYSFKSVINLYLF